MQFAVGPVTMEARDCNGNEGADGEETNADKNVVDRFDGRRLGKAEPS
jgi:hypothetical protein